MTKFLVSIIIEADDVTNDDVKDYVESAVQSYGGAFAPDSPFFGHNKKVRRAKVRRVRRPSEKKPRMCL